MGDIRKQNREAFLVIMGVIADRKLDQKARADLCEAAVALFDVETQRDHIFNRWIRYVRGHLTYLPVILGIAAAIITIFAFLHRWIGV